MEPSLITNSFESVFAQYQATNADLLRRKNENDNMLSSFVERYGRHFSNGPIPITPISRTHPTGSEATPLGSISMRYSPRGQAFQPSWSTIGPLPYESPTRASFMNVNNALPMNLLSSRSGLVGPTGHDWTSDKNGVANSRDRRQGLLNQEPTSTPGLDNVGSPLERAGQTHLEQDQVTPKPKRKASLNRSSRP